MFVSDVLIFFVCDSGDGEFAEPREFAGAVAWTESN